MSKHQTDKDKEKKVDKKDIQGPRKNSISEKIEKTLHAAAESIKFHGENVALEVQGTVAGRKEQAKGIVWQKNEKRKEDKKKLHTKHEEVKLNKTIPVADDHSTSAALPYESEKDNLEPPPPTTDATGQVTDPHDNIM